MPVFWEIESIVKSLFVILFFMILTTSDKKFSSGDVVVVLGPEIED